MISTAKDTEEDWEQRRKERQKRKSGDRIKENEWRDKYKDGWIGWDRWYR